VSGALGEVESHGLSILRGLRRQSISGNTRSGDRRASDSIVAPSMTI